MLTMVSEVPVRFWRPLQKAHALDPFYPPLWEHLKSEEEVMFLQDFDFMFITSVRENARRELNIVAVAGKGLLAKLPETLHSMNKLAKDKGCEVISFTNNRRGLDRLYQRLTNEYATVYNVKVT